LRPFLKFGLSDEFEGDVFDAGHVLEAMAGSQILLVWTVQQMACIMPHQGPE
jgi:hypothetical protein